MEKIKVITSTQNNFIRFIHSLKKKKVREEKGKFLLEGINSVREALKCEVEIPFFIFSEDLFKVKGGKELYEELEKLDPKSLVAVTPAILNKLSNTETPQGIIAVPSRLSWNESRLFSKNNSFIFILDGIQDPGNMGTIIRTADALKVDGIIVSDDTVDHYNPKTVRSTMGAIFRVPIFKAEILKQYVEKLKENNYCVIGTTLREKSQSYEKVDYTKYNKIALVIGNESRGICEEVLQTLDFEIKIPILSDIDSLNAGVATGISAYEIMKQKSWRI
ncbi:MAG: RNA methyltransferase [Candidatus Muiribacteriota bacterium]